VHYYILAVVSKALPYCCCHSLSWIWTGSMVGFWGVPRLGYGLAFVGGHVARSNGLCLHWAGIGWVALPIYPFSH